ncbi:hypothetical protein DPMN_054840, partial [Dreissena polymorpha]
NRCSDGTVPVVPGAVPVVSSAKPVIAGPSRPGCPRLNRGVAAALPGSDAGITPVSAGVVTVYRGSAGTLQAFTGFNLFVWIVPSYYKAAMNWTQAQVN